MESLSPPFPEHVPGPLPSAQRGASHSILTSPCEEGSAVSPLELQGEGWWGVSPLGLGTWLGEGEVNVNPVSTILGVSPLF